MKQDWVIQLQSHIAQQDVLINQLNQQIGEENLANQMINQNAQHILLAKYAI